MNEDRIKEDLRRKREALLAAQAAASGEQPPASQERQRPAPLTAEEAGQFGIVEARIPKEAAQIRLVNNLKIARRYDVRVRTIEVWMWERRIPYVRVGKRAVRFETEACHRAIAWFTVNEVSR